MLINMKNLFSKSLSKKKLVVLSASFLVFATAMGYFMYEGTKKTVALTIDGQDQVIKTHASTIQEVLNELDISLRSEDYLHPSADTVVTKNTTIVWKPAKQVTLIQDSQKSAIWTVADSVKEFLDEQEIALNKHDKMNVKPEAEIKKNMEIDIQKAFSFTLSDGGKKQEMWSTSTTVADFLSQRGIELQKLDRVEPGLQDPIKENGVVNIIRVEKVTDVVEEPIKFAVVTKKDSSLLKGKEEVVSPGQEGLISNKYEVVLENGKEVSRKLISTKTVKEKQDKVVAVGSKVISQQVSRGTPATARGKEFYVSSTAYTADCHGCSGYTATGINLKNNPNMKVIAVDPSVIPLGSKVYVDGYGYAIAADKGSSIKGNKIDVFFGSKSEAYRWGNKRVKIKLLN